MNNILLACGFVVFMFLFCFFWNRAMMKSYNNMEQQNRFKKFDFCTHINPISDLKLVGIENDGNSDYKVIDAIKKIQLPDELRIKKND